MNVATRVTRRDTASSAQCNENMGKVLANTGTRQECLRYRRMDGRQTRTIGECIVNEAAGSQKICCEIAVGRRDRFGNPANLLVDRNAGTIAAEFVEFRRAAG